MMELLKLFLNLNTLGKIKENKTFLSYYDSMDEILEELFPLIDENKIHISEEEGNKIIFIFELFSKNIKNMVWNCFYLLSFHLKH